MTDYSYFITESASACRTAVIFVFALVGFTRFVSITIKMSCAGSIQIEVPVNPVCPNAGRFIR